MNNSAGFQFYYWNGEPIKDIKEWCRKRSELMVRYKKITKDPFWGDSVSYCEAPESFFDTLRTEAHVLIPAFRSDEFDRISKELEGVDYMDNPDLYEEFNREFGEYMIDSPTKYTFTDPEEID